MANEKLEINTENSTENKNENKTTKTTVKKTNSNTKQETSTLGISNDLEKENNDLRNVVEIQSKQIAQLLEAIKLQNSTNSNQQSIVLQQPISKKFKVINLASDHNEMGIKSDRSRFSLKGYGTYKEVDEEDFRSIARYQEKFFKMGFLTTDGDGIEILKERGINVSNRWLSIKELENLDKFSEDELIELFNSLHITQQERLVEKFVDGAILGENKGFREISKISALNRVYKLNNNLKKSLQKLIIEISEK